MLHVDKISASEFYGTYHGHDPQLLEAVFERLVASRRRNGTPVRVIYLAGDSSMDNKYWISDREAATNGYETLLTPAVAVPDICHQINKTIGKPSDGSLVCINCAVEESTIGCRKRGTALLPQDEFLRDHLTADDVIVASVGGNDIALKPTAGTVLSVGWLSRCAGVDNIAKGTAWGMGHLRTLFTDDLQAYLAALCAKSKPALVVPSVIYYPDMNAKAPSWANVVLKAIGYNQRPQTIQSVIDRVAVEARAAVSAEAIGASRVHVASLSEAMNGTCTGDYVARVEPSAAGGAKIALLVKRILETYPDLHLHR
jgi:hypothetical protein